MVMHGNISPRSPNPGLAQLLPSVYDELRRIAEAALRSERTRHTLEPTALVHEVYLRLADRSDGWESRAQVIAAGAVAIRRILVDRARRRACAKRGGGRAREPLSEMAITTCDGTLDLLALSEALERLGALWPERARTIGLRFFGGLSIQKTAGVMRISTATVEREWRFARAWLLHELRPPRGAGGPRLRGPRQAPVLNRAGPDRAAERSPLIQYALGALGRLPPSTGRAGQTAQHQTPSDEAQRLAWGPDHRLTRRAAEDSA